MSTDAQPTDPIFDIRDRVVVITGGCGLIGKTLCSALSERGARVVVVDLPDVDPEAAAKALPGEAIGIGADLSKATEVAATLEQTLAAFGSADVLVNNHQYKPKGFLEANAETFPEELWDAVIEVNLKGTFLTCRDFGRQMLEQGRGSIINMASTYGVVSSNPALYEDNSLGNPVAYSASKGGVLMLTRYLGAYWASRGVRVNCVTPHGVWNHHEEAFDRRFSAMTPIKRMSKADELVGAVLYLASDASSYVAGSNLLVEGGWTAW